MNISHRCVCLFQQIMKDRWINAGSEEDELKPFLEPELDITDQKRIGIKSAPFTCFVCSYEIGRLCFISYVQWLLHL